MPHSIPPCAVTSPISPSAPDEQQAAACIAAADYAEAATLYEALIAHDPTILHYYWQLGLVRLLQGQEAEAQLIWMMAIAEGDDEQVEQWTAELVQVLQNAATQRATDDAPTAWIIRQHLREIVATDIDNLLHLLQLSLRLERFHPDDLLELGLIDLLQTHAVTPDAELLLNVATQLFEYEPRHPHIIAFGEACLPYVHNSDSWIEVLLETATRLSKLLDSNTLACRYGEWCLQLDPTHSSALLRLATFYQDEFRYDDGINLAKQYYAGCQTPIQQLMGNAVVLRGLMSTGARWQEARSTLDRNSVLIEEFLDDYQLESNFSLDASIVCTPVFFYPYFLDNPIDYRPLQNRLAQVYQASIQRQAQWDDPTYRPYPNSPLMRRDRSKIRVGYISRCMRIHSVGWLSRWVFQHYDRDRFEVYAYFNQQERIGAFSKEWFADPATQACCFTGDILGIAKAIREDEIDILVDLDSITADYTCGVMALKPAPVQVTWLGLDASGIPAVDYFIADPYVLPDQADAYYSEKIWRLPQTYIAVDGFEVGIPTLRRDQLGIPDDAIIYFSAQFAYKRHPETVKLQMQILRQVPNSYFLIKGLGDAEGIQAFFQAMAAAAGVDGDRLRFLPREASEYTHRANLGIADVVLDTYPYNGATTTLETLWMGIPIVTRVGQSFPSRNSYTMMLNAGVTEGIAQTEAEYVEWGVQLGQDMALRQHIAYKLKQSRQSAPLWNGRQYTRDLEAAYEQMWQRYLQRGMA